MIDADKVAKGIVLAAIILLALPTACDVLNPKRGGADGFSAGESSAPPHPYN